MHAQVKWRGCWFGIFSLAPSTRGYVTFGEMQIELHREVLPGDVCCIGMLKTVLLQLGMRGGGPNDKSGDVLL